MKYNYDFGTQFKTKSSGVCTLIKYVNAKNVYVMFEDGTVIKVASGNLLTGSVSNPNHPSVFGVGINDVSGSIPADDKRYTLGVVLFEELIVMYIIISSQHTKMSRCVIDGKDSLILLKML